MSTLSIKSTVYFDLDVHTAIRARVVDSKRSLSQIVNDAVRIAIKEDQEDLKAFDERAGEPTISHEELLEDLKLYGKVRGF